jgi:hypothetical protein
MKLYMLSVSALYIKVVVELCDRLEDSDDLLLLFDRDRRANTRPSVFGDDIDFVPIEAYTIAFKRHHHNCLVTFTNQRYEARKVGLALQE